MKKNPRSASPKNQNIGPGMGTLSVWAGEQNSHWMGSTQVPVVHSVSFGYNDVDEWLKVAQGKKIGHIYGRNTNPTVSAYEGKIKTM
jgi:cystathionine gamma-synthase